MIIIIIFIIIPHTCCCRLRRQTKIAKDSRRPGECIANWAPPTWQASGPIVIGGYHLGDRTSSYSALSSVTSRADRMGSCSGLCWSRFEYCSRFEIRIGNWKTSERKKRFNLINCDHTAANRKHTQNPARAPNRSAAVQFANLSQIESTRTEATRIGPMSKDGPRPSAEIRNNKQQRCGK